MINTIFGFFYVRYMVVMFRYGWYKHRKSEGYPISLRRAFFGIVPRFSSYEENEPGCPDWAKRDYQIVKDSHDSVL